MSMAASSLRKEIADCLTETRTLERCVVCVVGASIAWLAVNREATCKPARLPTAAWLIAFASVGLAVLRRRYSKKSCVSQRTLDLMGRQANIIGSGEEFLPI